MTDRELVARAAEFRSRAYAPYSGFAVGAALLGRSGRIYGGVNVENAAYPVGICAERAAIAAAVTSGERAFEALVRESAGAVGVRVCGFDAPEDCPLGVHDLAVASSACYG